MPFLFTGIVQNHIIRVGAKCGIIYIVDLK